MIPALKTLHVMPLLPGRERDLAADAERLLNDGICTDIAAMIWSAVMGVLGLPCNYARMPNLPVMMTGEDAALFSDEDLQLLLKNGMLLDGPAAEALDCRGFADAIGVREKPWTGPTVSSERWGRIALRGDVRYSRLEPLSAHTRIHSAVTGA